MSLFDAAAAVMAHLWDAEGQVYDDLRAALDAERERRENPPTQYVYVVRRPGDDFQECHVFADYDTANIVKAANDGVQLDEEPIMDEGHARHLAEYEADE